MAKSEVRTATWRGLGEEGGGVEVPRASSACFLLRLEGVIQPSSESESEEESCWLSAEVCAESTLVDSEAGGAEISSLLSSRIVASSSEVSCWTSPVSASSVCAGAGSDSVVTSFAFCSAGSWAISDAGNSFCSPAASLVGSSAWIPSLAGGAPFNPF